MLQSGGDRGREAAGDAPGPEGGRDPPRNLEGTSLRCTLSSVFELNLSSLACEFADPFFGRITFPSFASNQECFSP